jgi:predicted TIM-barrel fold metal-dependent hydrolase
MEGIIDAHVHFIPEEAGFVPGGKVVNLGHGQVRFPNGTAAQILPLLCTKTDFQIETLLRVMDSHGVEQSILIQGPVYGEFNSLVAHEAKLRPERLAGSMLVDPTSPRAVESISELVHDHGVRILKFECSESTGLMGMHQGLTFDGTAFQRVWETADKAGLTVVIDPGPIDGAAYQVERLDAVIKGYPRAHFVIAHLGFPEPVRLRVSEHRDRWWSMIRIAESRNAWIEISAMPYFFASEDYPFPSAVKLITQVRDEVGVEKLVWGSDIPGTFKYATYRQMIDFIDRDAQFSENEKRMIFRGNALKAFSLESPNRKPQP